MGNKEDKNIIGGNRSSRNQENIQRHAEGSVAVCRDSMPSVL